MQPEREEFKKEYLEYIAQTCFKPFAECSPREKYEALVTMVRDCCSGIRTETLRRRQRQSAKIVYYFSMEFLIGRLLENYLIQLGVRDLAEDVLRELGTEITDLFECERDPGLGNGGLGRLAACFLDSMASEDIACVGMGIRYRYGLFRQKIFNGRQSEEPDDWLADGYPWETPVFSEAVEVPFGGRVDRRWEDGRMVYELKDTNNVLAVPYDVPILGYDGHAVNRLRLWRARPVRKQLDMEAFNAGDYSRAQKVNNEAEAISCLLYPADHTAAGQRLRLQQEYFFVCAGIHDVLENYRANHLTTRGWVGLPDMVSIHTNDTHPALCVPELMRQLMDNEGLDWDVAWDITRRTVSYTNHTVMPEALEKWSVPLLQSLLPRIYQIIEEIDRRWREEFDTSLPDWHDRWAATAILSGGSARMANLSIIGGHSVNGVAALHTQILKDTVLKDFYALRPEMFQNKTNGVSHRRFLLQSNPELSRFITDRIGEGWITRPEELEKLLAWREDEAALTELRQVKRQARQRLCGYIADRFGIDCDPNGIMDVQVKRIHAYKRQLLNAFKILALYGPLRPAPGRPQRPGAPHHLPLRRQGRPELRLCQGHHPLRLRRGGSGERGPGGPAADQGGVHGELRRVHGADHLPRRGHLRADLRRGQGGQRHRLHEVHVQRRRDAGHAGRGQRGDPGPGGRREHRHLRSHRPGDGALHHQRRLFRPGGSGGRSGAGAGHGPHDRRLPGRPVLGHPGRAAQIQRRVLRSQGLPALSHRLGRSGRRGLGAVVPEKIAHQHRPGGLVLQRPDGA